MLAARKDCDPGVGAALAAHMLARCELPSGAVVAGYWPMGDEIDIRPLLVALAGRGHMVVLPETPPRGQPLRFRRWQPGDDMVTERFGTMRPSGEVATPTVLFVPLLAFDAAGRRLGYGGGYYDRTLAALPGARAIGCAYAAQQVELVPAGPHDMRLDAVATECGVVFCKGH